jgi:mannose-6-phosphate isomerase-like protein (cupin superfamily)
LIKYGGCENVRHVPPEIPAAHGHIDPVSSPSARDDGRDTAAVLVAQGDATGSPWLELSVMDLTPGRCAERRAADRETMLFVVDGEGALLAGGTEHPLEPHTGALIPPGEAWAVEHAGPGDLRLVAVLGRPGHGGEDAEVAVVRLADQEARAATGDRSFRVVCDPHVGCRSATQFVGFVPPGRAPEHLHQYDEVIYILDGEGVLHLDGRSTPFGAGATIHLPPRSVHCLENVGEGDLVVLGVFTPAGSPSDAFYPDGSRAYYDPQ